MEEKDLQEALDTLKTNLEGKSAEQVKEAIDGFKEEIKEVTGLNVKALNETLEGLKDIPTNQKEMQEHLDKLDLRIQNKEVQNESAKGFEAKLGKFIKDNGEKITNLNGKLKFSEVKAVGNMTTANLTGDEERAYSRNVIGMPGRLTHFIDLIGGDINIGVGTYTYPTSLTEGEGTIATQTEGSDKAQVDSDFVNVDVVTDFLAGFSVYSKKMRNNLPFLESFLPGELRRKYVNAEDTLFNTALAAAATASSQIITGTSKVGMVYAEVAALAALNIAPTVICMTPADYFEILQFEKSTGAGYGLPLGTTVSPDGVVRILGVPVVWVNWLAANKYYVGNFTEINRVITEGLSLGFSEHDEDNYRKNNITARIEAQIGIAIHRPNAIIYGDFTAT